jgi:hypothetical protein
VSPVSPLKAQQIEETPTPEPTDGPTPTPTPTHWSSGSVEIVCSDPLVSNSPLELEIPNDPNTIPLVSINVNLQLRDENDEVLLQGASFNMVVLDEFCNDPYMTVDYDWREHEGNLAIPEGTVYEYTLLTFSNIISGALKDGEPWDAESQEWYNINALGTPELKQSGEYAFVRSFQWQHPTPTPTPTPTPVPTPETRKVYLPIILRGR